MKKLPRILMRPEEEPSSDKPLWRPTWKCFCCHDTGIVRSHLAVMVIEGYNFNRDKLPRCQNPGCHAGNHLDSSEIGQCVDYRLTAKICQELDATERESWNETLLMKHQYRVNFSGVCKNLRKCDREAGRVSVHRTREEQQQAERNHAEALQQSNLIDEPWKAEIAARD